MEKQANNTRKDVLPWDAFVVLEHGLLARGDSLVGSVARCCDYAEFRHAIDALSKAVSDISVGAGVAALAFLLCALTTELIAVITDQESSSAPAGKN